MSASVQRCPVCSGPVPENTIVCPQCGFRFLNKTQAFSPVSVSAEANKPAKDSLTEPYLEVASGTNKGMRFYLDVDLISVGRDPKRDVFLNDVTVSRYHADIHVNNGVVSVVDKRSLNGVWVNGSIIDKETIMTKGETLQIGTFVMILRDGADEE